MNNRNILWILSSFVVATPLATFVAKENKSEKINFSKNAQNSTLLANNMHIINLDDINSVEKMLGKLNEVTNIFMTEHALQLAETESLFSSRLTEKAFKKLRQYTQKINFQYEQIAFVYGHKVFIPNLDPIKKQVQILKNKMELDYSQVLSNRQAAKLLMPSATKAPNMGALLKEMMGLSFAFKFKGFASIPQNGYLDYLAMIEAYHTFAWDFHQSETYRDWVKSNNPQYKLLKIASVFGNGKPTIYYVNDGDGFDKKPRLKLPAPTKPEELNNLEAQLILSMTNLYSNAKS